MRVPVIVAACVGLLACKDKGQPRADDQPPTPVKPEAKDAAPTPAPAPKQDEPLPEVVTDTFFRAEGATAAFRYPEIGSGWTASFDRTTGLPRIVLDFADGDARARLEVMFPPRGDHDYPAEATARAAAAELAKAVSGTVGEGKLINPGAYVVRIRAKPGAVEVVSAVLALVDGPNLALVVATGTQANLALPAFQQVYSKVINGVVVGRNVPRAPAADPGTPMSGAYFRVGTSLGEYDALIFDPRGYVHTRDELFQDLDAVWAMRPDDVDRYTFDGKNLTITDAKGHQEQAVLDGKLVMVGDARYCPGTGVLGTRLDGHWSAAIAPYVSTNAYDTFSVYQSSDYYFRKDGTFSVSSYAGANLANTVGSPSDHPEVVSGAADDDHGTYEIAGNRLILHLASGRTLTKAIYARRCGDDEDRDPTGILFVGGTMYLSES